MSNKLVPLQAELIDEGRFLVDINEALKTAMKTLIAYKQRYGKDVAVGAKAVVAPKIMLCFDGRDESDFSVKGEVKMTIPGMPPRLTVAIESDDPDEQPTLLVREQGSAHDNPRQAVIAFKATEKVDPETGEIKPNK